MLLCLKVRKVVMEDEAMAKVKTKEMQDNSNVLLSGENKKNLYVQLFSKIKVTT